MARHRKRVGKHRHRRRKMGAANTKGVFELLIGVGVGAIAADFADAAIALPDYVFGSVTTLAGGALALFMGDMPLVRGIGVGMLAKGVVVLKGDFMPTQSNGLNGANAHASMLPKGMAGFYDVPRVGGMPGVNPAKSFPTPPMVGRLNYHGVY